MPISTPEYCNVAAQALGLDPAGHGAHFDDVLLMETPLPWKREMYEKAGALPQRAIDLLALWLERYRAGQPYSHSLLMIAPDPEYSQAGRRRVCYFSRRSGPIAHFDRTEYLVPEAETGPLIWAIFEAQDELPRFDQYRVPTAGKALLRDILVCTHGTVDVACAKFGYPTYRRLRDSYAGENVRVWRVSHFGGHVFAPTLLEMPTGHYWAYVGDAQAEQIVKRSGNVAELRGHYRGWAGIADGFPQAAEREAWQREGWAWFDYAKSCKVLATDTGSETPRWMELRLDYAGPQDTASRYEARVEISREISTRPHTAYPEAYRYPQYVVTRLEAIPAVSASSRQLPESIS